MLRALLTVQMVGLALTQYLAQLHQTAVAAGHTEQTDFLVVLVVVLVIQLTQVAQGLRDKVIRVEIQAQQVRHSLPVAVAAVLEL